MSDVAVTRGRPAADVRAARWAVLAIFFINGLVIASWVAHIPYIKAKFGLSEALLGLTLLVIAAGSVLSLTLVGGLIARFGSRQVTIVSTIAFCAVLPLLLLVPAFPLLLLSLAFFGLCIGAMDVAMNAQAVAVEEQYRRPIMSTFHALFSTGGLAGAGVASLLLSWGISPPAHLLGVALAMGATAIIALRYLLPSNVDQASDAPAIALPSGPLLSLGILAFFCLVAEGAMADWSAVYLHETLGTDASFAAAGFAAFSLAMALGRFAGDTLRARLHAVHLVQISAILAAAGLGTALLLGHPMAALAGFACVGLGLSNIVPVLFSAAGRTPGVTTGTGIAAVATAGYFGFLAGPPLIGFVAQVTTLSVGLGLVVLFTALIALSARSAAPADIQPSPGVGEGQA